MARTSLQKLHGDNLPGIIDWALELLLGECQPGPVSLSYCVVFLKQTGVAGQCPYTTSAFKRQWCQQVALMALKRGVAEGKLMRTRVLGIKKEEVQGWGLPEGKRK